mgnify:CR=1 FL=1
MLDKERLKEIEAKHSILTVTSERNDIEYIEVDVKDLVFLIQNGFKQAERVQELEKQNKRYKQALEYIQRAIHTQHCTKNHKWNSEFEKEFKKGQTIGLIQASNIVDKAIRKVEGEE